MFNISFYIFEYIKSYYQLIMSEFNQKAMSDSESDNEQNRVNNDNKNKNKKKKKNNKNKSKSNSESSKPPSAMAKLILARKQEQEAEEARIKALQDEEERKIKEEEERLAELKKQEEELREQKRKLKQDKIQAQKDAGTFKTKSEKQKIRKNQERLEQLKQMGFMKDGKITVSSVLNNSNIVENQNINDNSNNELDNNKSIIELRCPLFTIVGHVDTGKTTLLDNLRKTNVQSNEVGGITQQIGATLLSKESILKRIENLNNIGDILIPGLLLVDTPGHEIFKNLRVIGSQLADIAIVIVDIVHGLEPQTIESIQILINSNVPFIFAFNKIDRLYGWNKELDSITTDSIDKIIDSQDINVKSEFNTRLEQIKTQIMAQGLNSELVWNNTSPKDTINIVPISAVTGQGIPDLLNCVINHSQTELVQQIEWKPSLECIIMEITNVDGYGYTIDCVIKNGELKKNDFIKIQMNNENNNNENNDNFIITKIKNILTIPKNKDSKSISKYSNNNEIKGACQIKIVALNLENSCVGSFVTLSNKEEFDKYERSQVLTTNTTNNIIQTDSKGISVFTSTQGSLESLVEFIRQDKELEITPQISYAGIGNVIKKDLLKLFLTNSEDPTSENLCVLLFQVDIDDEAIQYAKNNKITILKDETIYRLFSQYKTLCSNVYLERKEKMRQETVFPCILKIIESNIFNKKNPFVIGVEIQEGSLHLGTPLMVMSNNVKTVIGRVVGIQVNKKDINIGKQGQSVCIKIESESNITYGRHFSHKDLLYSDLTRKSVDILKQYFKKDLSKDDIHLLIKLKQLIKF